MTKLNVSIEDTPFHLFTH